MNGPEIAIDLNDVVAHYQQLLAETTDQLIRYKVAVTNMQAKINDLTEQLAEMDLKACED